MPRLREPQIDTQNNSRRPHDSTAGVTDYEEFGRKLLTAIYEETRYRSGYRSMNQRWFAQLCSGNRPRPHDRVR
jgi:hypothetical protein